MAKPKPKALRLEADPRWPAFIERYALDLYAFAVEACLMDVTPQQEELFDEASVFGCRVSVSSGHGCFAQGTEIMRADGTIVPVEQIPTGERLMGADGRSVRTVVDLKRGREPMYRFTYADGTCHTFNESHILCLVATNSKGRRVAGQKVEVTVREWLTWGEDKKRCHAVYRSGVDSFRRPTEPLSIPPYVFGAWLGDGDSSSAVFTTADPEIVSAISEWAVSLDCRLSVSAGNSGKASRYHVTNGRMGPNQAPAKTALRALGVLNNKHIPDRYLYASKANRLELLAGLIDTDGHKDKAGYDFIQKNERLAKQVAWLARSVGCHSTIREVTKTCGNNGVEGTYWRVTIGRNVEQIPVRIPRKVFVQGPRQRGNLHFSIKSCDALGEGDYFGFVLDGDHKFLGGDFTVLHNTGKTRSFGVICLWHLLCYLKSNTYVTAPKLKTVREGVWKEITTMLEEMRKGPHAWIAEYVIIQAEKVYVVGHSATWYVTTRTAPRGNPENLAGTHADYLLWLADEASGIPDENFGVIGGALTDERNRFIMASQPTRSTGFFWETHHGQSSKRDGPWVSLVFNSEESPIVSLKFIKEKRQQYGGVEEAEYQIKVRGMFPTNLSKYLLSTTMIERSIAAASPILPGEEWGHIIVVDVAAGMGRDKTVATHMKVSGNGDRMANERRRKVEVVDIPIYTATEDWTPLAVKLRDYAMRLPNVTIVIDITGMGIQFMRRLEELQEGSMIIQGARWGDRNHSNENRKRFINQRAQCTVHATEAIKDGVVKLSAKQKRDLIDQGSRLPYSFDELGRFKIASKDSMAADGLPSPDLFDTICMAFLEDVRYVACSEETVLVKSSRADAAMEKAKQALADVA